jgi:hypothetical protein
LIAGIKQKIASSCRLAAEFDKDASLQRKPFLPLDWYPKIETKAGTIAETFPAHMGAQNRTVPVRMHLQHFTGSSGLSRPA